MKATLTSILFLLLCSLAINAQTRNRGIMDIVEYHEEMNTLVQKVIDVLGGKEANLKVRSFRSNGEIFYRNGEHGPFDFYLLGDNWARVDYNKDSTRYTFAIHGRRGWTSKRTGSGKEENRLKGVALAEAEQFHIYENNLFDYKEKGLDIYYEGEAITEYVEAYIIRLDGLSFGEEMYYISKKDYRPFMKQVHILRGRNKKVIHYNISEYMQVGEVMLPRTIAIKKDDVTRVMLFSAYDLTAELDKDFFVN